MGTPSRLTILAVSDLHLGMKFAGLPDAQVDGLERHHPASFGPSVLTARSVRTPTLRAVTTSSPRSLRTKNRPSRAWMMSTPA